MDLSTSPSFPEDPLEQVAQRTERAYIKITIGAIAGFALFIGICWLVRFMYVHGQERRLLRQAAQALQTGDQRTAGLAARSVLQSAPHSIGAARVLAQLAEQTGDRAAVDWRRNIAEAEGHTSEDVFEWVRAALLFKDIGTARRALSKVDEAGRQTAGYNAVCALLAKADGDKERAVLCWREALRLAPSEKSYQLQLGAASVNAPETDQRAEGERLLQQLSDSPKYRAPAMRELIASGVAHQSDAGKLIEQARQLQTYPEATLDDRLLYLDFLHQIKSPEFTFYLTRLQTEAASDPGALSHLLAWMSVRNLNLVALDFVKTLPAGDLQKWPVVLAVADIYSHLDQWDALEASIKNMSWGASDYLRHAYLARAARAKNESALETREWDAAKKQASEKSELQLALLRVAVDWGWTGNAVDILWDFAKDPDKQSEALTSLYKHYSKTQNTVGLYRVMTRMSEIDPDNLGFKNNVAQMGLLLNADRDQARRIASEIHDKAPDNAAYATTYAYSLLNAGEPQRALGVMQSLSDEQLHDPAIGTYYGICLAAIKDERARSFLELAQQATLLPEEKALVAKAESALR